MTRKNFTVSLLFIVVMLTGCLNKPVVHNQPNNQITVFTSFYPLFYFTEKIGGDKISVENLLPAGIEPHGWEPSPQALAALQGADLLVVNGLGLEPWLEKIAGNLDQSVTVVNASVGIKPLYTLHSHEHNEGEDEHNEGEDEHEEVEGEVEDPHVWLDPLLAVHQAENIASALMAADPENAAYYQANLDSMRLQLEELDQAFREELTNVTRREFVVTHLSFAYMAKRYGLTQEAIAGLSSHAEPSPVQMRELVDFARMHDIRYIFSEPLSSNRLASVLAEEINATLLTINPLEGLTQEEVSNGDDYLSIMYRNLAQLKKALAE